MFLIQSNVKLCLNKWCKYFSQNKIAKIIKMKDCGPKKILTNMWFITQIYE